MSLVKSVLLCIFFFHLTLYMYLLCGYDDFKYRVLLNISDICVSCKCVYNVQNVQYLLIINIRYKWRESLGLNDSFIKSVRMLVADILPFSLRHAFNYFPRQTACSLYVVVLLNHADKKWFEVVRGSVKNISCVLLTNAAMLKTLHNTSENGHIMQKVSSLYECCIT